MGLAGSAPSRADLQERPKRRPPGTASTAPGGPAGGLGRQSASRTELSAPRGERLPRACPGWAGCRNPLGSVSSRHCEAMRVGKSYVTLGPSSALARARWRYSPPHPTVQMGTQSAEGDGIGSRRPLIPEILPTPNPNPLRGGESKALECSRVREPGGSGVSAGPPEANAEGIRVPGNQSCRAPGRGLGARRRTRGRGPGRKGGPGRLPRAMAAPGTVVQRLRSRPHCSNFPAAWRANRALKAREAGREGAVRGSWYRVRVWRGAAPRRGLRSPPDRPPRAACSGAGHRRVSLPARRLISGAPAAPGSPRAVRSSLAARWLQLQARGARSKRPEPPHPRAPCPGPGRPAPPAQRPAAVGRAFLLSIAPAARAAFSGAAAAAQVRDQLSLASSAPLGPRHQTPPPDAPSLTSRLARPPPAGRAFAALPFPPTHTPTRSLRPSPGTHADPGERREGWPGAQGMNISVLAKLPSADVMAPAAVVTRRIPQRDKEEARGSGSRCWLERRPAGPPAVRERDRQRGGGPANLLSAPRLWRIRETLPGSPGQRAEARPR